MRKSKRGCTGRFHRDGGLVRLRKLKGFCAGLYCSCPYMAYKAEQAYMLLKKLLCIFSISRFKYTIFNILCYDSLIRR